MTPPRYLPVGDAAILVELSSLDAAMAFFRRVRHDRAEGVEDIVPAARTVLVRFDPGRNDRPGVESWLRGCARSVPAIEPSGKTAPGAFPRPPGSLDLVAGESAPRIEIPVCYDGEDLHDLAAFLDMTPDEVVARHTGTDFVAAFAGFAPGFVYLAGGDPCFAQVPRRAAPRTRVPAGTVATAAGFSAVYPSDSPGGWQLLGHTPLRLWDLARDDPALIQPGVRVRFTAVADEKPRAGYAARRRVREARPAVASEAVREPAPHGRMGAVHSKQTAAVLEVRSPGLQTLFQDSGRSGFAHLGVSGSGALDREAMHRANHLVGNRPDAPVLENVLGDLVLVCHGRATLSVVGARASVVVTTASGMRMPAAPDAALDLEDGYCLKVGRVRAGVRCYVAARGGWAVAPVLGSCSTDVLSGIGPAPLGRGDRLPVGSEAPVSPAVPPTPVASRPARNVRAGDGLTLDVILGPRSDWFSPASVHRLLTQEWTVTADSNRVGMRLSGACPLERQVTAELLSEGMIPGAIEVPPSGQPLIFMADCPLTGGYPVIAGVTLEGVQQLAQVPAGARLRFRESRNPEPICP